MYKFVKIILSVAVATFASGISVLTMDEQLSSMNNTSFRFKVVNASNDTLHGVELRYHVKHDSSQIVNPDIYHMPGGVARWTFDGNNAETLIISFPNVTLNPGETLGGDAGFVLGLHSKNWGVWTKQDDPSQPSSSVFAIANNIEVFSQGVNLLTGVTNETSCPTLRFVEVEKDSVSLEILQMNDADGFSIVGENGVLADVDLNDVKVDLNGRIIWRGAASVQNGKRGEFWAECNGSKLAYFAYGWKPTVAHDAVDNGLWESDSSYVVADFSAGFNRGLNFGQRLMLNEDSVGNYADARVPSNWSLYRAWEDPGDDPIPLITTSALMRYGQNDIDSLSLSWTLVDEASWYHLIVMKDSVYGDTVESLFTQGSSLKIPNPGAGSFVWFVEPLVEASSDEDSPDEVYYTISGDDASRKPSASSGARLLLKRSTWGKFKKWAGNTVKKAVDYVAPAVKIVTDVYNGGLTWGNVGSYAYDFVKGILNPLGVIQIFSESETLHTRTNSIKKDLSLLKYSYVEEYVYIANPFVEDAYFQYLQKTCFGTETFCAMKDTRMIVEIWDNGFNEKNWNKIYPKIGYDEKGNVAVNYPVHTRCWLTMAQMINHYKGGNISSDEILYGVRGWLGDTAGGDPFETINAVRYALGQGPLDDVAYGSLVNMFNSVNLISADGWFAGTPLLHTIIETIESGNVIGVSQLNDGNDGAHSMVLNGYKIDMNGNVYIHLLNLYNMGEEGWRYYGSLSFLGLGVIAGFVADGIRHLLDLIPGVDVGSGDMFFTYYIPPLYAKGRSADSRVFEDSDNDGVVDFDESVRFKLDPNKADTDGDGLNDYDELLDYKLCESNKKLSLSYAPLLVYGEIFERFYFTNAAKHRDADGDGFCDIQETGYDVNAGTSLCDRYDESRHPEGVEPQCAIDYNLAMLATDLIQLNDRAYCVGLQGGYCPIASYGTKGADPYGVVMGVRAQVGNIYSAKSIFMRNSAIAHGNVETGGVVESQGGVPAVYGILSENSVMTSFYTSLYAPVLENAVLPGANFSKKNSVVYEPGTVVDAETVNFGKESSEYIFNSNSVLVIQGKQQKVVNSLLFQAGAYLYVQNGGLEIHIGEDFQWNGIFYADDIIHAAQNVIVFYYGTKTAYIQTNFAGTIVAPNAEVVIGQAGKHYYGSIFAKSIVVHQNTTFTWVPYAPSVNESVVAHVANQYNVDFFL